MIQQMLAIWSLVPLPFLNPTWRSWSSWFTYYWSLTWRFLSITLLVCEMSAIMAKFEHCLPLPFFGIGMKTDLFQSCGHWWVFLICWHSEWSTFTASSFRIWNTSTGIPSPPLALFVVMLPKAHLTSHSRMSGSEWVITLSRLSGAWRSFLYSATVYSCHLFLMSSASVMSIPFLLFIEPIFAWYIPLVSLVTIRTIIRPSNPTTGHTPWRNHNSKRQMHPNVHCSTINITQDKRINLTFTDRWVDKDMVHIYSGVSLGH